MQRIEFTAKNFFWSTISSVVSAVLGFVSRTIFLSSLGIEYLGLNSLFINVIAMLSLSELGIGVAINYSLYKPIAENDIERIKSLMHFYKRAYRYIGCIVTGIGLGVMLFLPYIVKDSGGIRNLYVIYLIFLFNAAYSYLFSYKRTLLAADQKTYRLTMIDMVVNMATATLQMLMLLLFKRYLIYLLISVGIGIIQNIYINRYINKTYPYLLDKQIARLSKKDRSGLMKNIKALMLHKIGDLCVFQTDSIIISSFINITMVGVISNYTLLINTVNRFVSNAINAANASLGNIIAVENSEKQKAIFRKYDFLAFWIYSWSALCFYFLINPFITLWLGNSMVLDQRTVGMALINFYILGRRLPIDNIKSAAGAYRQDKYVPMIESLINLVSSIIAVRYLGVFGVYLGTFLSSILPAVYKPMVVYRHVFHSDVREYFLSYMKYALVLMANVLVVSLFIRFLVPAEVTVASFVVRGLTCLVLPNLFMYAIYRRTEEFKYIINLLTIITLKRRSPGLNG
ncbi:MAG TPA: oligosaccharide flippase family protein [Clostridiales bacterium]|nr:oligosaccharide flippase family protein [Clostridiales bacterium]